MTKRLILACALVLALVLPAQAEGTGIYAGLKIIDSLQTAWLNGTTNEDYTQNTFGGGIFAGYDFFSMQGLPVRVEAEYAARTALSKSYDGWTGGSAWKDEYNVNLQTLMGNVYLDLHTDTAFTPYIGAGIGMGIVNAEYEQLRNGWSRSTTDYETVLAWNVGAGCSYAFNEMVSADLAYRYVGISEAEFNDAKIDLSGHEFSLGLRFNF